MDAPATTDHGGRHIGGHPVLGPEQPAMSVVLTFDGRELVAREEEPLAASLLAAGVRVWRMMPETGEERGGYCLVVVDGVSNVRACRTPVRAGMAVERQAARGPG